MTTFGSALRKSAQKYQENHYENSFLRIGSRQSGKPYKRCHLLRLLEPLCEKVMERIKKTNIFQSKWMTLRDLRQVNFSLGKSAFREMTKMRFENLINTVVYLDF